MPLETCDVLIISTDIRVRIKFDDHLIIAKRFAVLLPTRYEDAEESGQMAVLFSVEIPLQTTSEYNI